MGDLFELGHANTDHKNSVTSTKVFCAVNEGSGGAARGHSGSRFRRKGKLGTGGMKGEEIYTKETVGQLKGRKKKEGSAVCRDNEQW